VTTETLWIVIAVVAAVLIIAVALGLVLRRRRRISLREPDQVEPGTGTAPPRRGGTYQAGTGFAFSSGSTTEAEPPPAPAPGAEPPAAAAPSVDGSPFVPPTAPAPEDTPAEAAPPAPPATGAAPPETPAAPPEAPAERTAPPVARPAADGVAPPEAPAGRTAPPPEPAAPPATAPPATAPPSERAPAPPEIASAEGRLDRLRGRLARSRSGFGQGLLGLLGAGELDEESWEDVEATLLQADLGPEMTVELVETLRTEMARRAVRTPEQARQLLRDVLTDALRTDLDRSIRALPHDGRPAVMLVVGVNGTGKTTTTGKLARVLVAGGRHVVLGAADTFRAAAAEQLVTWGERAGATVVRGPEGADPASVAFDAVKQGAEEGADAVLLDTAGRLHTKTGLMDELGKVKRVVERQAEVDEVLLVLDATTGQNGLIQARVFGDVVKVTGIALTKLDGTAKGGIVFRVQRELGVPVKLVGLGEGPDDLAPFEPAAFVEALLAP
jgi:fused signal recognition particle receptor